MAGRRGAASGQEVYARTFNEASAFPGVRIVATTGRPRSGKRMAVARPTPEEEPVRRRVLDTIKPFRQPPGVPGTLVRKRWSPETLFVLTE